MKLCKKILACMLAVCLILCTSLPVFAADIPEDPEKPQLEEPVDPTPDPTPTPDPDPDPTPDPDPNPTPDPDPAPTPDPDPEPTPDPDPEPAPSPKPRLGGFRSAPVPPPSPDPEPEPPAGPAPEFGADGNGGSYTLTAVVTATGDALANLYTGFRDKVLEGLALKDATKEEQDARVSFDNTAVEGGSELKASLRSFKDLLLSTFSVDNKWDADESTAEVDHVRLTADVTNEEIQLSDSTDPAMPSDHMLHDVDFTFHHVTVAPDDNDANSFTEWGGQNVNDDGYFQFYSVGHVSVTFQDSDLKQNVQSGSTGNDSEHNVDLTFTHCNFNGMNVYGALDPEYTGKKPTVDGKIFKSYQGDNIGTLLIDSCVNLHSVNATGSNGYSNSGAGLNADGGPSSLIVRNSTFVASRKDLPEQEGQDIGYRLVFGQKFANYEFSGNRWADDNSPIYVEAFNNPGFLGAAKADYFYNPTYLKDPSGPEMQLNNEAHWNQPITDEEGNADNAVINNCLLPVKYSPLSPVSGNLSHYVYAARVPVLPTPDPDPDPVPPTPTPDPDPVPPEPTPDPDPVPDPDPDPVPPAPAPDPEPTTVPTTVPEEPEQLPERVIIEVEEDEVPLAGGGAAWALYNFALMELAIFESVCLAAAYFLKRNVEENEKLRGRLLPRIISIPVAIISVVTFILTENIHAPLVLTDRWTPLMAAFALVQSGLAAISKPSFAKAEQEEQEV